MKKFLGLLAFVILVSLLNGCAKSRAEKQITKKDDNVSIRIEGATYPSKKQIVIASVSGYVKSIRVDNGVKVNKGDLIYSLDKELIHLDIDSVKEEIATLERIRNHKTQRGTSEKNIPAINLAAIELRKVAFLQSKGYVNGFEANKFKKNYINAIYDNNNNNTQDNYEKHQNINKQIMKKKVALKKLEYRLHHADGHAPISGYITKLNISEREHIQGNQKICAITDIDTVIVRAGFATGLLHFIKVGQQVKITFLTVPTYKVFAKVSRVNPFVDNDFNNMTIDMLVPNHNYILQEGTRTLVNISLSQDGQTAIKKYFRGNPEDRVVQISSEI